MSERFELTINSNGQADIIDRGESKEKNAICIYNDLGILPYSSAKAVCDKLNEQEETIQELKKELKNRKKLNTILEGFLLDKGYDFNDIIKFLQDRTEKREGE